MSKRVRVELRGRHARLIFDDGRMNLLSHAGLDAISEAFDSVHRSISRRPGPHAGTTPLVTFESARAGIFAAGADMREMRRFSPADAVEFSRKGQELFSRVTRFPALTSVIVDGDCFGGALDFMMSFDLRISTERSRFSHPGGRIGIITGFGGTSAWRRSARSSAVGPLFLGNEILSPARALDTGLIHEVSDDPDASVSRLLARTADRRMEIECLKRLATAEKNLGSLALHSRRLHRFFELADTIGRNTTDGCTRDTSRSLFG